MKNHNTMSVLLIKIDMRLARKTVSCNRTFFRNTLLPSEYQVFNYISIELISFIKRTSHEQIRLHFYPLGKQFGRSVVLTCNVCISSVGHFEFHESINF